jgi:hypothetical protein
MGKKAHKLRALVDKRPKRNDSLYDNWSLVHLISGIGFGWTMPPFIALALLVLWEPLEILVLSPILAKYDIIFGYETIRNSLSDIFFDTVGVLIGAYLLIRFVPPPFQLF